MPAAVLAFILSIVAMLVVRVLVAAGVGFVTYQGLDLAVDSIGAWVEAQFGGLPYYMVQLFAILRMDVAISIILAAYGVRVALSLVGGTFTRLTLGNPGNALGIGGS